MSPSGEDENNSQIVPRDQMETIRALSFSSSSSSSSSGSLKSPHSPPDDSPLSCNHPVHSYGIPFSWEHLPGIPKKQTQFSCGKDVDGESSSSSPPSSSSLTAQGHLLPLPPSTAPKTKRSRSFDLRKKKNKSVVVGRDPFITALVQCSKHDNDDDASSSSSSSSYCRGSGGGFWIGAWLSRSILITSDRLGLFTDAYTSSCKRSCAVSQSIIRIQQGQDKEGRSPT